MARRLSQEEAELKVKEAIKNQGDTLVVEPFIYTNRDMRLQVTCSVCGNHFDRDFREFINKNRGCQSCKGRDKSGGVAEELLIKESNGRYSWKPFEFKTTMQKIDCTCNTCGIV